MEDCQHKRVRSIIDGWSDICLDCSRYCYDYESNWRSKEESLTTLKYHYTKNNNKYGWLKEHIDFLENSTPKNPIHMNIQDLQQRTEMLEIRLNQHRQRLERLERKFQCL